MNNCIKPRGTGFTQQARVEKLEVAMYARRLKCGHRRWGSVFQPSKDFTRPNCVDRASSQSLSRASIARSRSSHNSDGRNTSEEEHIPVKDGSNIDKGKSRREKSREDVNRFDAHARLGEQDQREWLSNEKLAIEYKKKESPFLTRREKFKTEFLRRIVPWEKISVSWETFPYYIHEHTKNLLVECAASHLKHKKFTTSFGARLMSSSGRILLQSVPGTELYRERLVRALARDLQVPLLVLDSNVLAPYDFGDDCASESESEDDAESGEECTSESEVDDENDATNEEDWTSSGEASADGSDNDEIDMQAIAEAALKKVIPHSLEEFEKRVSGDSESSPESSKSEAVESSDDSKQPLKKGNMFLIFS
ncbi:hypothetical protein CMV_023437 [Castanea mollissima]|uniref:Uncharacterized protein n=1 Tax=Castanea mollissima TaxID=60419 RepID=A0A8J4VJD5_9ROSI|nr:hypothetical protein CMV_023437 [Castanea mollissima]